jgi:glycosyltransferase involved in cell wall biosynthesis
MIVCYFTSKVSNDVRVFGKECVSLAKAGYKVYLISPNAKDAVVDGVQIIGVPYSHSDTFSRLFILPRLLYKCALKVDADIYHFNDPASLFYGYKLKLRGKKVIFDSFEDHPTLILEYRRIPLFIKKIISKIYTWYENRMCSKFDGIIMCYHWTQERLSKICHNNQLIFNFPIIKEEKKNIVNHSNEHGFSLCYAGLLSEMWNIESIVLSLSKLNGVSLNLAGHGGIQLVKRLEGLEVWSRVNYLGKISHDKVHELIYSRSNVGIALLDYIPLTKGNIGNLSNNKLFEYMLAGLPVICTDFILWKEIIEKNQCGICIPPKNEEALSNAISFLIENPAIAKSMGENGRKCVLERYNWSVEEKKLLSLYDNLYYI